MTTNVHLTPELENFARTCVDSGRFDSVNEVVHSAMRLLREQEKRRNQFTTMLEAVQLEAEREGVCTLDEILNEMDEVIAQVAQ